MGNVSSCETLPALSSMRAVGVSAYKVTRKNCDLDGSTVHGTEFCFLPATLTDMSAETLSLFWISRMTHFESPRAMSTGSISLATSIPSVLHLHAITVCNPRSFACNEARLASNSCSGNACGACVATWSSASACWITGGWISVGHSKARALKNSNWK